MRPTLETRVRRNPGRVPPHGKRATIGDWFAGVPALSDILFYDWRCAPRGAGVEKHGSGGFWGDGVRGIGDSDLLLTVSYGVMLANISTANWSMDYIYKNLVSNFLWA